MPTPCPLFTRRGPGFLALGGETSRVKARQPTVLRDRDPPSAKRMSRSSCMAATVAAQSSGACSSSTAMHSGSTTRRSPSRRRPGVARPGGGGGPASGYRRSSSRVSCPTRSIDLNVGGGPVLDGVLASLVARRSTMATWLNNVAEPSGKAGSKRCDLRDPCSEIHARRGRDAASTSWNIFVRTLMRLGRSLYACSSPVMDFWDVSDSAQLRDAIKASPSSIAANLSILQPPRG